MFRKYFVHCRRISEEARRFWARVLTSIGCQLSHPSAEFSRGWLEDHIGKISLSERDLKLLLAGKMNDGTWISSLLTMCLDFVLFRETQTYLLFSYCKVRSWICRSITRSKCVCGQMNCMSFRKKEGYWRTVVLTWTSAKHAWRKPSWQKPRLLWVILPLASFLKFSSLFYPTCTCCIIHSSP